MCHQLNVKLFCQSFLYLPKSYRLSFISLINNIFKSLLLSLQSYLFFCPYHYRNTLSLLRYFLWISDFNIKTCFQYLKNTFLCLVKHILLYVAVRGQHWVRYILDRVLELQKHFFYLGEPLQLLFLKCAIPLKFGQLRLNCSYSFILIINIEISILNMLLEKSKLITKLTKLIIIFNLLLLYRWNCNFKYFSVLSY